MSHILQFFSWMRSVVEAAIYLLQHIMEKDFDVRNDEKKIVEKSECNQMVVPRRGEVRLIKLGLNIGHEQDGKGDFLRPLLVICARGGMILGLPMTTKSKGSTYNVPFLFKDSYSYAMLNQIRSIDKKRCIKCMGILDNETFHTIKKLLAAMLRLQEV